MLPLVSVMEGLGKFRRTNDRLVRGPFHKVAAEIKADVEEDGDAYEGEYEAICIASPQNGINHNDVTHL